MSDYIVQPNKVTELRNFLNDLIRYHVIIHRSMSGGNLTKELDQQGTELLFALGHRVGFLGQLITELTGLTTVDVHGSEYDMWVVALKIPPDELAYSALGHCIQITNRAIGQLENDIKTGIRDRKTGKMISPIGKSKFEVPKAFVSHGKESVALQKLEEFLHNLGIIPLIVKDQPSLDKTVDDKVEYYLNQADFVIILATGDDEFDGKLHPRQNVIHEVGLSQKTHAGKIIYLLEEGAEFPSNINPKVWERFKQRNMLSAFLCIIRELRALGMLLAVKGQT
jgi:predicted nucleotide-binding protein